MNVDPELPELLDSSTVQAVAPSVTDLRQLAHRRRRLRTSAVAGIVGLTAAAGAVVGLALVRLDPATTEVETVTSTETAPSTDDRPPATSSTSPTPTTGSDSAAELAPNILVPASGEWEFVSFGSTGWTTPSDLITVITEAGGLGPVAWIGYNADVDTLDYEDGPLVHHDTTSPEGRSVRVGYDTDPEALTAIFLVDTGSVAVSAYDIAEGDLLLLVDAITVADERPVLDPTTLPAGLRPAPLGPETNHLAVGYSLRRGTNTIDVSAQYHRIGDLSGLLGIRHRPNITATTINGHRTYLVPGDHETEEWPTAVIEAGDWVYTVALPPWDATTPPASTEDLETIISAMAPIGRAELLERASWVEDRQELLDRWFADVTLPPDVELEWLRDGPPLGIGEAELYYQILTCTMVINWAETGSTAALDHVATSGDWAVTADLTQHYTNIAEQRADDESDLQIDEPPFLIDQADINLARAALTEDQRRDSALFEDCAWVGQLMG